MSYVKLPTVVSDYAVGLQSVNQAIDNNEALFQQLDTKHVTGTDINDVFQSPGRHDDRLIARTVCDFLYYAPDVTSPQLLVSLVSGPMVFEPPTQLKEGQWRINVAAGSIFSARATVKGASVGVARVATCRVVADLDSPYVVVTTWDATIAAQTNYSFSLVLWSDRIN